MYKKFLTELKHSIKERGFETYFLTGADEHGLKIEKNH